MACIPGGVYAGWRVHQVAQTGWRAPVTLTINLEHGTGWRAPGGAHRGGYTHINRIRLININLNINIEPGAAYQLARTGCRVHQTTHLI